MTAAFNEPPVALVATQLEMKLKATSTVALASDPTSMTGAMDTPLDKVRETTLAESAEATHEATQSTESNPVTGTSTNPQQQPKVMKANPQMHTDEPPPDGNTELPSPATLQRIGDYVIFDKDGKTHPFKSLYTGQHVARRVLVIFVRHFFCGNCQEYLRTLSAAIAPESLLQLPISTFIAVVGCGDAGLISMYAEATGCPFPIYADPTRRLYAELGMTRTLAFGERPSYMKKSLLKSSMASVVQCLKQIRTGMVTKAGDQRQTGGEFLFEPPSVHMPVVTPWREAGPVRGNGGGEGALLGGRAARMSQPSLDGKGDGNELEASDGSEVETKRVTWCHRMKTTRDHAEMPELFEVLGLSSDELSGPARVPTGETMDAAPYLSKKSTQSSMSAANAAVTEKEMKRWSRALEQRKGTGFSMAAEIAAIQQANATESETGRK